MALTNTSQPLAARVFLQCYEEFKTSVRNVRSLADELHSRGLVGEVTLRNVHSRNLARSTQWLNKQLFLATHQELCTNPMKFAAMLEALKSDSTLKPLCKQVELAAGSLLMPTLQAVVTELKQMCGWVHLGLCFRFPRNALVALCSESVELSKIHLVTTWLGKEEEVTWKDLVVALCGVNRKHLAVKIAAKYGVECAGDPCGRKAQFRELMKEAEDAVIVESLVKEMEEKDTQILEVEEDIEQSQSELMMLEKQINELQQGNVTMRRCNSELLVQVFRTQAKVSENRGSSNLIHDVPAPVDASMPQSVKVLQENMQRVQSQLEAIRQNSKETRTMVSSITSQVEAITSNLQHLIQQRMELSKAMWHCERSMNSYLLQCKEEPTPQRGVLSAVDLHSKFVKVELESHEKRLEELETRRSTLLKTIDDLEQEVEGIEATNKIPPTEVQPSLDTIYSSAIQKHGTDNYLFYLESCILQKRMQLALLVWENYTREAEMYPLIQELAELQSMICGTVVKKEGTDSVSEYVENGEQDDSSESDMSHPLDSPIESSLDWVKQRPSIVQSPPAVENQYIAMEKHMPQTSHLPLTSEKDEKKFLSLRRFTQSKHKTKASSKKKERPIPPPPPQPYLKKYHTIAYRGELKPAVTTKTTDLVEEQPWYAHVSREIAEYRLKHCNKDGAYLVRPSSTAKGTFVLSLLYGGRITHARIEKVLSGKYTVGDEDEADFCSVVDLVEHYQTVPFVVCGSTTLRHAC